MVPLLKSVARVTSTHLPRAWLQAIRSYTFSPSQHQGTLAGPIRSKQAFSGIARTLIMHTAQKKKNEVLNFFWFWNLFDGGLGPLLKKKHQKTKKTPKMPKKPQELWNFSP